MTSNPVRVLALDDEEGIRELITDIFTDEGYAVRTVAHPSQLIESLESFKPNILLLDQILPDKHGVEIIQEIRESLSYSTLPVLMVSGQTSENEKVTALDMGVDDYLTKPFSAKELIARVRALLRRADVSVLAATNDTLSFEQLEVNLRSGTATLGGVKLSLTTTEFRLLVELLANKNKVLSREHLIADAMGGENVTHRTVDVHMAGLRKKLGEYSRYITTARGIGYRFDVG